MKFSFVAGEHKFKCVQCGKCCYPAGLSLTPKEHEEISKQAGVAGQLTEAPNPPFSHILVCKGRCPFLSDDMLCNIYTKRPAVCASFPLTFTYTPEGELYVNFIRCPGTDVEDGEVVDEKFVENTVKEVEARNPGYFAELKSRKVLQHQLLSPFYSGAELADFDSKEHFREKLADLLLSTVNDQMNFRSGCHAFLSLAGQGIESEIRALRSGTAGRRTVIFKEDVHRIEARVEREIQSVYENVSKDYERLIRVKEEEALRTGFCEIFWEGEVRRVKLNEQLETLDLTGSKRFVKASTVYMRREFSPGAFKTLVKHLAEALVRVELGGFPMDTPISLVLQILGEYVNNLETACYIYSQVEREISDEVATEVVYDYDTFFVLGDIHAKMTGTELPHLR